LDSTRTAGVRRVRTHDLDRFWNPKRYPLARVSALSGAVPRLALRPDETMKKVVELGLIGSMKSASPVSPTTHQLVADVLRPEELRLHRMRQNFTLIREGKANKQYWAMMGRSSTSSPFGNIPRPSCLATHAMAGLRDEDLRITRPSRRDWPDFVYEDWAKSAPGAGLTSTIAV